MEDSNKFAYFGYGSNMLADRIHLQNPTAQRIGVGELKVSRKIASHLKLANTNAQFFIYIQIYTIDYLLIH